MGKSGLVLVGSLILCPGSWCAQGLLCALPESVSPVLCKFWQLYGGVNGDLLQEGLCHTQVYRTQSPWTCSRPLLTCTSAGDTQTQFWLSLCRVTGSWCAQDFVGAPRVSLVGMGFDSKCDFPPPTILLGRPLFSWMWVSFLVGSNIVLLMVV